MKEAPFLMPLFVGSKVPQGLTVTLSQVLFPILVMLGTTGMVVGILNSYNRFGAFAISPFFWNVAISEASKVGVVGIDRWEFLSRRTS